MNSIKWIREALFGAILLFVLAACSDSGEGGNPLGPEGTANQNLTDDKTGAPDGGSGEENRDSDGGDIGIVPGDTDEPGGEVVDPGPGDTPGDYPSGMALSDLLTRIQSLDGTVEDTGELIDLAELEGPGHVVLIDQDEAFFFVYDNATAAKDQAIRWMSGNGFVGDIGISSTIHRLYALDRFVILYPGDNKSVTGAPDGVFGGPVVGPTEPVDGPIEPPDHFVDDLGRVGIVTVDNGEHLDRLLGLVQDEALVDRLSAVDFETDVIMAVLRGEMPTAGYSITIEDVRFAGEIVEVVVSLTNPGPDEMVAQVITHPLAVEVISRVDVEDPSQHGWAVMSANGELLVELHPNNCSTGSSDGGTVVIDGDGQIDDPLVDPGPDVLPRDFHIRGTITAHEEGANGLLARVLIENEFDAEEFVDAQFVKAWVEITDETLIQRSGQEAEETVGALEPGVRVQVVFDGAVRESYPVQATAGFVVILE